MKRIRDKGFTLVIVLILLGISSVVVLYEILDQRWPNRSNKNK